jgi:uncharacterized phage protein (TIGR01671 family)
MRAIEFRAWDKSNKRFVNEFKNVYICDEGRIYTLTHGIDEEFLDTQDYEIMQFTGLLDKNGTKIYEGDVVEWKSKHYWHSKVCEQYEIRFGNIHLWSNESYAGTVGFYCVRNNMDTQYGIHHLIHNDIEVEVIGNIHQNKELIKESE